MCAVNQIERGESENNLKFLDESFAVCVYTKTSGKRPNIEKMIFATATRFIVRRNAIQKVYWRTVEDVSGVRLVKYSKICNFKAKPTDEVIQTQFANNQ